MKNSILIIDFDSTFVKIEGLEELAKIALAGRKDKEEIVKKLQVITNLGMEGKLNFRESLKKRLELFSPQEEEITKLVDVIRDNTTDSVVRVQNFIREYAENIYIISGGFAEWIIPIVSPFGISKDHILCNTFIVDEAGKIVGFDENNPLTNSGGKVEVVRNLKLNKKIIVVGDGYTDYEIKKAGVADTFIAFTENIARNVVVEEANFVAENFEAVIAYVKNR